MNNFFASPEVLAFVTLRIIGGVLFVFQGYDKLFKLGIAEASRSLLPSYRSLGVPPTLLKSALTLSSVIEFAGGLSLITGIMLLPALSLLCLNLIGIAIAFSLINPVWDLRMFFYRLIIVILVLLLLPAHSYFSLLPTV